MKAKEVIDNHHLCGRHAVDAMSSILGHDMVIDMLCTEIETRGLADEFAEFAVAIYGNEAESKCCPEDEAFLRELFEIADVTHQPIHQVEPLLEKPTSAETTSGLPTGTQRESEQQPLNPEGVVPEDSNWVPAEALRDFAPTSQKHVWPSDSV